MGCVQAKALTWSAPRVGKPLPIAQPRRVACRAEGDDKPAPAKKESKAPAKVLPPAGFVLHVAHACNHRPQNDGARVVLQQ